MTKTPNRKGVPPNPPPPPPARPGGPPPPSSPRLLPPIYVVHKWRLRDEREVTIDIAAGARILKVGSRGSAVFLWALVRRGAPLRRRSFRLVSDDAPIVPLADEALTYIGSSTPEREFVWHVFEIERKSIPPVDREPESPGRGGNDERA